MVLSWWRLDSHLLCRHFNYVTIQVAGLHGMLADVHIVLQMIHIGQNYIWTWKLSYHLLLSFIGRHVLFLCSDPEVGTRFGITCLGLSGSPWSDLPKFSKCQHNFSEIILIGDWEKGELMSGSFWYSLISKGNSLALHHVFIVKTNTNPKCLCLSTLKLILATKLADVIIHLSIHPLVGYMCTD